MTTIKISNPENFESALRKFKRMCDKAGIISKIREKQYYEKPKWLRKRKKAEAIRRNLRRINSSLF